MTFLRYLVRPNLSIDRRILKLSNIYAALCAFALVTYSSGFAFAESIKAAERVAHFSVDQDLLSGAVDFSWLNRPLTKSDTVFIKDGHFFTLGPDGKANTTDDQQIRFAGINLAMSANFPTKEDAERLARRFSKLGVNLVRLHGIDGRVASESGKVDGILDDKSSLSLNALSVNRLKRFIQVLSSHGIYVNLNLHVVHQFSALEGVPAFNECSGKVVQSKPLHIFYPKMVEWQRNYVRLLVGALGLKGSPSLAMVEISNEASLVDGWQEGLLDKLLCGPYRVELLRQWNIYVSKQGLDSSYGRELIFPKSGVPEAVKRSFVEFLVQTDAFYIAEISKAVHDETRLSLPVTGTQIVTYGRCGHGGFHNVDVNKAADYLDSHFYIDHYSFPNRSWDWEDWRISNSSLLADEFDTLLNVSFSRVLGKPFTVSEFNQPWPNQRGAELLPVVSAFGRLQDWDAIILYAYTHDQTWDASAPNDFSLNGDWAKYVQFGQMAWYFRTAVSPSAPKLIVPVSYRDRIDTAMSLIKGQLGKFITAKTGLPMRSALSNAISIDVRPGTDSNLKRGALEAKAEHSIPGILSLEDGVMQIDAPQMKGIVGNIGNGKTRGSGALTATLLNSDRGFASLLLSSLDPEPVASSRHLLLTAPGYVLRSNVDTSPQLLGWYGLDPRWTTVPSAAASDGKRADKLNRGSGPAWMERIEALLLIETKLDSVKVFPLDARGKRLSAIGADRIKKVARGFEIHINATEQQFSPWYEIVSEK